MTVTTERKKAEGRAIRAIVFVIFACSAIIAAFYLADEWYYLPFNKKDYEKSFNEARVKIGQPIIEDYFIPKWPHPKSWQAWFTPDSLKFKHLHSGKIYGVEKGEIEFERDGFVRRTDSTLWLKLTREYDFKTSGVVYYLDLYSGVQRIKLDTLNRVEGDSILNAWRKEKGE